jgi:hypothetical protein
MPIGLKEAENLESVKLFARGHGYALENEQITDTFHVMTFKKTIRMDHDIIGDITIEHTRYFDDEEGSDEYVYPKLDSSLFAREARDLAKELNIAADIADKLDIRNRL